MPGRIVILNGAPRSGKSTLARAIQADTEGHWINWGVDAFNGTLPPALVPGIGLRPGGERPDLEAAVQRLYASYFAMLAALAGQGFDVVADLGMHADYAAPFDPFVVMQQCLAGLPVLLVGVECDLATIMARRRLDTDGRHVSGPDVPPPLHRWQAMHEGRHYDLRLDMGHLTAAAGAALVGQALIAMPGR
ncbi:MULTISPECIES: phosphotransferase-like protein [Devosia]|uniref:phosphotransferase-like protein n=1 Tax=Devosia TaxID=46913 RepID=UPI000CE97FF2|nr:MULTISPECIES: chloramphenicol phosphotransferase [Devosia]AVF03807.1 chloramphenicol phosphotransferase [Devosia sp. I507]